MIKRKAWIVKEIDKNNLVARIIYLKHTKLKDRIQALEELIIKIREKKE